LPVDKSPIPTVIASDSEAIQTKPQLETLSLGRFALLAMTESATPLPTPMRLLILGGTSEASALAAALAKRKDVAPILSLAGRTGNPRPAPIPSRTGGFGGVEGLRAYLSSNAIGAVVDATHPFAEQISGNAAKACAAAGVPLLVFTRPPWRREPGDDWIEVDGIEAAVDALGARMRTVFLTHGRLQLAAFGGAQLFLVVGAIAPPADIDALPGAKLILARGPFALADEERLMHEEGVELLVTKNSGGAATYPKIEAARRLGVTVVVVRPPAVSNAETATDLSAALAWIEAHRPAP
jgi:precorrin-6A/cobalt-precorrin-6A reductase